MILHAKDLSLGQVGLRDIDGLAIFGDYTAARRRQRLELLQRGPI